MTPRGPRVKLSYCARFHSCRFTLRCRPIRPHVHLPFETYCLNSASIACFDRICFSMRTCCDCQLACNWAEPRWGTRVRAFHRQCTVAIRLGCFGLKLSRRENREFLDRVHKQAVTDQRLNPGRTATSQMKRPRGYAEPYPIGRYWRCALVLFGKYGVGMGTEWRPTPFHAPIL